MYIYKYIYMIYVCVCTYISNVKVTYEKYQDCHPVLLLG